MPGMQQSMVTHAMCYAVRKDCLNSNGLVCSAVVEAENQKSADVLAGSARLARAT